MKGRISSLTNLVFTGQKRLVSDMRGDEEWPNLQELEL